MMETELPNDPTRDAQSVLAVRRGDVERYRELVERHERRVYAVAWSRLGDAGLAEEATQEAFIRAYRRLSWLGDGRKFAGWVNTIARRVAINFGLRHRRELNKRERWALENPSEDAAETDPLYTQETLRQTLAELPDAHRECLVLFYLEGKSGSEAATALGISEAALRVRLHRARAIMRERLEDKLEGSLARLHPSKTLVSAVMAGVLASSSAKAAAAGGGGAVMAGALARLGFTKWLLPFASFFSFLFFLPMFLGGWLFARMELKNFRDQTGFRARLFRARINRWILLMLVVLIAAGVIFPLLLSSLPSFGIHLAKTLVPRIGDPRRLFFLLFGVFCFPFLPFAARQLAINRNPYLIAQVCFLASNGVLCLLAGLSLLPIPIVMIFILGQSILALPFLGQRPVRMDYNLFLRATEGLLKAAELESPLTRCSALSGRRELLAFARFLGSRWLVDNYRWVEDGLRLRLPLAGSSPGQWMSNRPWKRRSQIQLGWNLKVSAQLCETDQKTLSRFYVGATLPNTALEMQVAAAVAAGWQRYRESNVTAAELALGEQSEREVFVVPLAKGGVTKMRWLILILMPLAWLSFSGIIFPSCRERLNGLKRVNVSEAQVRAFLNDTTRNPDPKQSRLNSPSGALFHCLVLPSTNLFSPEGLRAMRDQIIDYENFDSMEQGSWRANRAFNTPMVRRALAGGWFTWNDLGTQPTAAAVFLHTTNRFPIYSPDKWDRFLVRCQAWSWVKQEKFEVMRIHSDGVTQLRLLQAVNCLDLTDSENLIQQISSLQVLSATPPGRPPIHDWQDVRGLFFTPCYPALEDTYFSLAALEILGGLEKIDREACIRGILRQHQGKGFFTSPDSGGFNEYHIEGSAHDSISAFESLRILGGLDRVRDLDKWRFRVASNLSSKPAANGVRTLTWYEVEAWVCQQRLEKALRERKSNPNSRLPSLRQP
jgi:RNA polymerase sigma-70 factor (ECF subfamily)